jgi:hypothetical protein
VTDPGWVHHRHTPYATHTGGHAPQVTQNHNTSYAVHPPVRLLGGSALPGREESKAEWSRLAPGQLGLSGDPQGMGSWGSNRACPIREYAVLPISVSILPVYPMDTAIAFPASRGKAVATPGSLTA